MKRLLCFAILFSSLAILANDPDKPNIIFILADDMGYADLGCYGGEKIRTPVADQMADEGMRFTSFYTHPVCCPTRTAILSGSYAMRVAEYGNVKRHHPFVHLNEVLIPEILKPAGYVSACIGKWDLNGHRPKYTDGITPNHFGFDYSFGRPSGGSIFENGKEVQKDIASELTRWYTDAALKFMKKNRKKPFFIYLAHTMPHVPLDATEQFKGKSERGIYGDVIEELDWNVGRIVDKVKELGLDDRTVFIYTSDNGPWPAWTGPEESGETGPLRGQKCETWEGGVRVPFIIRAPGIIPSGKVCNGMIGDVDMLPTFAALAGVEVPRDRIIDGKNLVPLLTGQTTETPVKTRYYYYDSHLQAVRSGKWKLILSRPACPPWLTDGGLAEKWRGVDVEEILTPQLYDLENDIGETTDLAGQYPQIVKKLLKVAEKAREDIGDYNRIGNGARFYEEGPKRPDVSRWQSSGEATDREEILTQLRLDPGGKTEVVKEFPVSFPEALTARGEPLVYTRQNSEDFEYIGMPVGGIGAGQLYLGGDGQLWFWDIFGLNYQIRHLKGEEAYEFPYTRSKPNEKGARMIDQGFSIKVKHGGKETEKLLNRDGFTDIEFLGQYPIGEVTYRDKDIPVEVRLEAFSPFIPLELDKSIFPAAILSFRIRNTSDITVEAEVKGWLENAVLTGSREKFETPLGKMINNVTKLQENGKRLACSVLPASDSIRDLVDFGTMALTVSGIDGEAFSNSPTRSEMPVTRDARLTGELTQRLTLDPGCEKEVTFLLTWHFPKSLVVEKGHRDTPKEWAYEVDQRHYAKRFSDATEVSEYVLKNLEELTRSTRLWRDTWYNSTLPYWFLDRTFLNSSILASSTSSLLGDKLFYGTEGGNQGVGTCTHVWGYVQAMGRLFPELETSLREKVDFVPVSKGGAMRDDGTINFRWYRNGLAVDGQSGIILRSYLTHQMTPDNSFLERNYQEIKKAMQGLTQLRDADHDGILTGGQHNTLDADWYGKITWLSLHYTAALRATAEMAKEMGDHGYSGFCRETADKGRQYIEKHLFNGEYFFHEADPDHPQSPGTFTGLEYSQLLGQSWAYQVGLGEIIDPQKAKMALESMWRYNFTTDVGPFRAVHKPGRWYAMPGEGGLIACTWPRGGSEVLAKGNPRFAAYNNECQNGYEYAATSLMMWQGMPYHSLAHIWYMHYDRYHGSKRNPWCEIEWGLHYSRSMASYGHFVAACGFEYHGPKGFMVFSPKITPEKFKSAFTAASGWGTFTQDRAGKWQRNIIEVRHGKMELHGLGLDLAEGVTAESISVTRNGEKVEHTYEQMDNRVTILFNEREKLSAEEILQVNLNNQITR